MKALEISDPSAVQGIAVEADASTELWLANLTGREQTVSLPRPALQTAVLDAASFGQASRTADLLDRMTSEDSSTLTLGPYSTIHVRL